MRLPRWLAASLALRLERAGMALSAADLVEKAKVQRKERRFQEALVSAQAATRADPTNPDGWWQVALCFLATKDEENALPALKSTTELAPGYAYGWTLYGTTLSRLGKTDLAQKALERAIAENPDDDDALTELANIYENAGDEDAELRTLERLDRLERLPSGKTNRIGILYHRRKNFLAAISYYRKFAKEHDDPAGLFNLGLVYRHQEVSQEADAIDIWRLTCNRYPNFERSMEIEKTLLGLLERNSKVDLQPQTLLGASEKFRNYINPFEILNLPEDTLTPHRQKSFSG
jgi:tetratricopeptide (TPR) repeat protein